MKDFQLLLHDVFDNDEIIQDLLQNPIIQQHKAYLGAGCINQRIWNHLTNRESTYGIGDYDVVYYDSSDITEDSEKSFGTEISKAFPDLEIDCVNQARVHVWYPEYFGKTIPQYQSIINSITDWPTTASSFILRFNNSNEYEYAIPHGSDDLIQMILRPNKQKITKEIYEQKVNKWKKKWPELTIIPW